MNSRTRLMAGILAALLVGAAGSYYAGFSGVLGQRLTTQTITTTTTSTETLSRISITTETETVTTPLPNWFFQGAYANYAGNLSVGTQKFNLTASIHVVQLNRTSIEYEYSFNASNASPGNWTQWLRVNESMIFLFCGLLDTKQQVVNENITIGNSQVPAEGFTCYLSSDSGSVVYLREGVPFILRVYEASPNSGVRMEFTITSTNIPGLL